MPVTASQIKFYAAQNTPADNSTLTGGDINSGLLVAFTDIGPVDKMEFVSNGGANVGDMLVIGRDSTGQIISETITLAGETPVEGTLDFERVLIALYDNETYTGIIIMRDSSTSGEIITLENGETGIRRVFYDATANAVGGGDITFYEKFFVMNTNPTNTFLDVTFTEVVSGLTGLVDFGLENRLANPQTIVNRLTAPTGVSLYGEGPSGIPDPASNHLLPLDYQGVWLKLTAPAGSPTVNSFYQLKVAGRTT
jgi:hypothetical protein